MKKENNNISDSRRAGYTLPATRVINIGMRQAVLTKTSVGPTETEGDPILG